MAASTTTFEERISRIQARAAAGTNDGVVAPGVAPAKPTRAPQRKTSTRGRYILSALGGLFASLLLVGIATAFLMSDMGAGTFEMVANTLADG